MKRIALLLTLITLALSLPAQEAAQALARRILGKKLSKQVVFELHPQSLDYFDISTSNGKIIIKGNSDNSLCVGLGHYLREYAHIHVSWLEEQPIQLPRKLPFMTEPVMKSTLLKKRFMLNYCTYGYTMPWWGWKQWERFIDWMALNGVTMPLALTGQEAVWQEVWRSYGMSDDEIRQYFSGPAHLPWHRMANLDGFGGPLPQSWIDGQKELQMQILERERSLGMTPILPAFAGHVPAALAKRFPQADIKQLSSWCGFEPTHFLNSTDPLFADIQRRYLQKQTALFGTDHIYGCDPFNEMDPPSWENRYLADVSKNIYGSMQAVDPQAQWLQMTWVFYYKRKQWTPERLQAYLTAVPKEGQILLDYFCENTEVWHKSESFFDNPFIWCYLGNFGGNTMLVGNMHELESKLEAAVKEQNSMVGVGSTLESFDCSPQIYEYLFSRIWTNGKEHDMVHRWAEMWAQLRAGDEYTYSTKDWLLLTDSVYRDWSFYGLGTQLVARPSLEGHGTYYTKPYYSYNNKYLLQAWRSMAADAEGRPDSYQYDLVNLGSQYLGNKFMEVRNKFSIAYRHRNIEMMEQQVEEANRIFDQADELLSSHPSFLLGKWIEDARMWGKDEAEKALYEKEARTLLTTWGGPILNDYANRMWGGLVKGYYAKRWNLFFDAAINAAKTGFELDEKAFGEELSKFEHDWTLMTDKYPSKPKGNTGEICWNIISEIAETTGEKIFNHTIAISPEARLQDIYKSSFQDEFGPAHIISDSASCIKYIESEVSYMKDSSSMPMVDVAGAGKNYVRVNLSLVKQGVLTPAQLADALMKSADLPDPETLKNWTCKWEMIMAEFPAEAHCIENFAQDSISIDNLLKYGKYVMHHSHHFNQTYDYHYRLIKIDIFFKELWPIIYNYYKKNPQKL